MRGLWRFRGSLIPGGLISISLLAFAIMLFFTLINAKDSDIVWKIDEHTISLLKFTLFQAFLSTFLSIFIGLLLAWSLAHQPKFKARSLLITLFSSSLVLPTLIVVFGLITVLGRHGWLNQILEYLFGFSYGSSLYGLGGILIAHVYLNASFAAISLLGSLENISTTKYKLAKSLGFTTWQRFLYIEWIALSPTVASLASTIFLLCFTSFAIVLILGGSPSYNTLEVAIYEAIRVDFDIPEAVKL
jgi:thiamine transport system permease protein